jgi:hypothetical protein
VSTQIAERLESLGLSFALPDDQFWRQEMPTGKTEHLFLFTLDKIAAGVGGNVDSHADGIPVPSLANITDVEAGVVVAAASTVHRKVSVYNNGPGDIVVMEGSKKPGFEGQPDPNGAGDLTSDFGIVLEAGDGYESPVPHKGPVTCRTRDGEESSATVTHF